MITSNLPGLIVITPLIMSAIVAFLPSPFMAWLAALLTSVATLVFAYLNAFHMGTESISYAMGGWPPPWGIEFISDGASRMMALILSSLSVMATLYSKSLFNIEINQKDHAKTYAAWLLAMGGLLGLVMTADTFNLFVFLEISALASVTLIAMGAGQDRRALVAAYNYLLIGAIGATFYVIGVGFCYAVTGSLNMVDLAQRLPEATTVPVFIGLAFMVTGIMVKAAAFPVHIWLPAAYGYAPSAVSALLAAIATKAAIYALARILFTVFGGISDVTGLILYWVILPLSLFAMFVGTILAIYEQDLKKLLAQSSIAQIGYITLAFAIATPASISAGFIHMANHAIIKGGLFMAVGAITAAIGRRANINTIAGIGRAMPWTGAAMLICGLSLIGLPLTAGFISKIYLVLAVLDAELFMITALVLLSSALSVIYLWKMIEVMWMRPYKGPVIRENPMVYLPLWLVAVANIIFGIYADPIVSMANQAAQVFISGLPIGGVL